MNKYNVFTVENVSSLRDHLFPVSHILHAINNIPYYRRIAATHYVIEIFG